MLAISLLEWSKSFPDYFMTKGWNKRTLVNVFPTYIFDNDNERSSDHNGISSEWAIDEVRAFDAIYDSQALVGLSAELGYDVRKCIEDNFFLFEGNMFVTNVPIHIAAESNLPYPYPILAKVARTLNRPAYIDWLDRYLDTVLNRVSRDITLREGIGYSMGYISRSIDTAQSTADYFLTRDAYTRRTRGC